MKRIGFFVGGNFPAFGHARDRMKIVRILADKSLEQRGDDVERADAIHEVRIKVLHLFPISFVKNLKPIPFLDRGLNSPA
jgi:hypothetical protein